MKIVIKTSDDKEYPCRMTMGALLRFKHETGKDVSEMGDSVSDMAILIWCCVVSACNADGVEFGLSAEDFADRIDPEEMKAFGATMTADASAKKKTVKR